MKRIVAELVENYLIVWNPKEGTELYRMGYYGKPLGIPKPKSTQFNTPLILDLMEGLYLLEKKMITVKEGTRKIKLRELQKRAHRLTADFLQKYTVYRHLRNRGLTVTPGIKFGSDFAVYKHGPGVEHAPYMITVKKPIDEMTATEIVKAGRLATTVRKRFIIAASADDKVEYFIFKWFKA